MFARLKQLLRSLTIYGAGDVATQFVGFLLLPVYTRYLTQTDYGIIAALLMIEAPTKILFRWGVDTAFMRLYYDCPDERSRQRLASTVLLFLFAANGIVAAGAIAASDWIGVNLLYSPDRSSLVVLLIVNTFVVSFYFIPYYVLRITNRSRPFVVLTFAQSAGTLVMRLVLVVWFRLGVLGVVLADVCVTSVFVLVLIRWFVPLIRPVFSLRVLREVLRFGLPRVPHSLGSQVISLADRYFLNRFVPLADVGLYSIGATFGLTLKLFLGAFETAWTPFFLGVMKEPNARQIYAAVSTYALAALALLGGGLCSIASDLVRIGTAREFATPEEIHATASVVPWIALGVMCQGVYILGSIGLVITKRTMRYPIATGVAAVVSVGANLVLIPQAGMIGAAWSNVIAYGTLAVVTVALSWRVYPIRYEWGRIVRIGASGIAAFLAATRLVPVESGLVGLFARGSAVVAVYLAGLFLTGFFHPGELRVLNEVRLRALQRRSPTPSVAGTEQAEMAGEIVGGVAAPITDDVQSANLEGPVAAKAADKASETGFSG